MIERAIQNKKRMSQTFIPTGILMILTHGLSNHTGLNCYGGIYSVNGVTCHGNYRVIEYGCRYNVIFDRGRLRVVDGFSVL
jgi:hypothetical protein